jgi:hypothetical protein
MIKEPQLTVFYVIWGDPRQLKGQTIRQIFDRMSNPTTVGPEEPSHQRRKNADNDEIRELHAQIAQLKKVISDFKDQSRREKEEQSKEQYHDFIAIIRTLREDMEHNIEQHGTRVQSQLRRTLIEVDEEVRSIRIHFARSRTLPVPLHSTSMYNPVYLPPPQWRVRHTHQHFGLAPPPPLLRPPPTLSYSEKEEILRRQLEREDLIRQLERRETERVEQEMRAWDRDRRTAQLYGGLDHPNDSRRGIRTSSPPPPPSYPRYPREFNGVPPPSREGFPRYGPPGRPAPWWPLENGIPVDPFGFATRFGPTRHSRSPPGPISYPIHSYRRRSPPRGSGRVFEMDDSSLGDGWSAEDDDGDSTDDDYDDDDTSSTRSGPSANLRRPFSSSSFSKTSFSKSSVSGISRGRSEIRGRRR